MTPLGFRLLGYVSQECVASWKIKVISKYNIYFGHLGGIKKRHEQFNEPDVVSAMESEHWQQPVCDDRLHRG